MAIERIVNIKVQETGLDELNQDLVQLDKNLDKVSVEGEKAADSVDEITKNGGAIALLDQLTGGLATRMRDAWEATKLFNTSLKGTRAALIATGIGAIVVALGAIVAYWDEIKIAVSDTNFLINQQIDALEKTKGLLEGQIAILDKRMELNELEGRANEELQKQKIAILEQEQKVNDALIEKLEWQLENERLLAKEITLWERIKIEALKVIDPVKAAALEAASRLETTEETLALEQRINEAKLKQIDLEVQLFKAQNPESETTGDTTPRIERLKAEAVSELEVTTELAEQKIDVEKMVTDSLLEEAERRKRISDTELQYQIEQNDVRLNSAQNLANALFMLGEENKAFAVVGIIVDQVASAARAIQANVEANAKAVAAFPLTAGQPWVTINTASTVAGIAAGALAAKKAISQIGGGGSVGRFNAPQGQTAPSFNVVGTSGVNQLAQSLQQDNEPLRAYVVGSDITSQQALDRNVVETATIVG